MKQLDNTFVDVIQDDCKRRTLLAKTKIKCLRVSILAYIGSITFGVVIYTDQSGVSRQLMSAVITLVLWMIVFKFESDIKLIEAVDILIASNRARSEAKEEPQSGKQHA